jgi:hypothetical protein
VNFGDYIKEAGPFTAPLCLGMLAVIKWLLDDRTRLLTALLTADDDRRSLREKRADDLLLAANEYKAQGESMRVVMHDWNTKAQVVLDNAKEAITRGR